MTRMLLFVACTIGGAVGWWIGSLVGTMTAFLVSLVGTAAGVYAVRRFAAEYLG
jgi:hypothetical protein